MVALTVDRAAPSMAALPVQVSVLVEASRTVVPTITIQPNGTPGAFVHATMCCLYAALLLRSGRCCSCCFWIWRKHRVCVTEL